MGSMLSGCSPIYVMRAAYEEGKILWRREPIADYIQRPDVTLDTQEKLKLVLAVREYARDVLKLNVGGSYSSYSYVDRPDLTYIVVAAPKTELQPVHLVVFDRRQRAVQGLFRKSGRRRRSADDLDAEGYDTNIRPSAAFSTLGWFDDPLLSHLSALRQSRAERDRLSRAVSSTRSTSTAPARLTKAWPISSVTAPPSIFFAPVSERKARSINRQSKFGKRNASSVYSSPNWRRALTELYNRDIPREDKLRLREEVFTRGKAEWARRIADRPQHRAARL